MAQKVRIIGVPMDLGQSRRGVDMGPSALRGAGLQARIKQIDGIKSGKELAQTLAALHLGGTDALFAYSSDQDAKDATQMIGETDHRA